MSHRVAIVFCVHHKPWLIMSTLITLLAQDFQDADLFFLYNVGAGAGDGPERLAVNTQLSPFDERVRNACRLQRGRVFEVEYENDEALDSGAWYKFIRDGRWKPYDWVLFVGEGTLFARPSLVSAMLELPTRRPGVHVIASGHEKRRIPKNDFLGYSARVGMRGDADRMHDAAIAQAFDIFCRDPEFQRLFLAWGSDFPFETQHHVPSEGPPSEQRRRLQAGWMRVWGQPADGGALRQFPWTVEYWRARARVGLEALSDAQVHSTVYVNGKATAAELVADIHRVGEVGFHRVEGPEWFGCATNHLMSRTFLERLSAKLDEFQMYDVLSLRFAGTPLEVIWGFLPAWLGFEKWFTDGFHRVRKDFVTYRREDNPPEMATYINRYYRGSLAVAWHGDYLSVGAYRPGLDRLREQLPSMYF